VKSGQRTVKFKSSLIDQSDRSIQKSDGPSRILRGEPFSRFLTLDFQHTQRAFPIKKPNKKSLDVAKRGVSLHTNKRTQYHIHSDQLYFGNKSFPVKGGAERSER
jgi:hypothetical protein